MGKGRSHKVFGRESKAELYRGKRRSVLELRQGDREEAELSMGCGFL